MVLWELLDFAWTFSFQGFFSSFPKWNVPTWASGINRHGSGLLNRHLDFFLDRPKPPVKFDHFAACPAAGVLRGQAGRVSMGHSWILFHGSASIWQLGVTMWQAWRCVFKPRLDRITPPKTARELWPFCCLSRRRSSGGQARQAFDGSPVNYFSWDYFNALHIRMLDNWVSRSHACQHTNTNELRC